ncbi:MAG: ferrochelatase [Ardenticatenia bacterium]|nr:MAG: ferrochelatase [Ardenticatenia bacterium]
MSERDPIALLVMAYGGPNSLDDIEPYLLDIRGGRATPPELVEEIRERYALIGGRSPLLDITRAQAEALAAALNAEGTATFKPYVGMRHWFPYIREAVEQIVADGLTRVVALVMAPHYSRMSIGAYIKKVEEAVAELGADLDITYVRHWGDHPLYIEAVAEHIREALQKFAPEERERVKLLFTAHSLPVAIMQQGDPYDAQLRETARLVAERLGWPEERWLFCYQSAGASNAKWLGPDINDVLPELAAQGETAVLVAPVGFVADHVEILYDIDIEARQIAEAHGLHLERMASMNTAPRFIEALAAVVREHLEAGERATA